MLPATVTKREPWIPRTPFEGSTTSPTRTAVPHRPVRPENEHREIKIMGRRLTALAAAAIFALAFSVTPALADGKDDPNGGNRAAHWTVIEDDMTDIAGMGPVECGSHSYTVVSGSVHFLWLEQGAVGSDAVALTDGKGTEDWTLLEVKVVDQAGRVHRVEGRQHTSASWSAGQNIDAGPIDSYRLTVDIQIEGTNDGHHVVARWLPDGSFVVLSDSGTCAGLTLFS